MKEPVQFSDITLKISKNKKRPYFFMRSGDKVAYIPFGVTELGKQLLSILGLNDSTTTIEEGAIFPIKLNAIGEWKQEQWNDRIFTRFEFESIEKAEE